MNISNPKVQQSLIDGLRHVQSLGVLEGFLDLTPRNFSSTQKRFTSFRFVPVGECCVLYSNLENRGKEPIPYLLARKIKVSDQKIDDFLKLYGVPLEDFVGLPNAEIYVGGKVIPIFVRPLTGVWLLPKN